MSWLMHGPLKENLKQYYAEMRKIQAKRSNVFTSAAILTDKDQQSVDQGIGPTKAFCSSYTNCVAEPEFATQFFSRRDAHASSEALSDDEIAVSSFTVGRFENRPCTNLSAINEF